MNRNLAARLDRLDRANEERKPVPPGLVIVRDPEAGDYTVGLEHFPTVEAAKAAFPERTLATLVIEIEDASRPEDDIFPIATI